MSSVHRDMYNSRNLPTLVWRHWHADVDFLSDPSSSRATTQSAITNTGDRLRAVVAIFDRDGSGHILAAEWKEDEEILCVVTGTALTILKDSDSHCCCAASSAEKHTYGQWSHVVRTRVDSNLNFDSDLRMPVPPVVHGCEFVHRPSQMLPIAADLDI